MNIFSNKNAITFIGWFKIRKDNLSQIVFYFLSQKNATSQRYHPFFNATENVRIVYLRGLRISYTDKVLLKIFWQLVRFSTRFANRYKIIHVFNTENVFKCKYQVLHIDDPSYSENEKRKIAHWERKVSEVDSNPIIVCTNQFTAEYLRTFVRLSKVEIIEQGFSYPNIKKNNVPTNEKFRCVYSSQYIHYGADKHASHSTWGCNILFDTLIPLLFTINKDIEIHLIGELGNNAKSKVEKFGNVVLHGLVDSQSNMDIIGTCDVGLYPRKIEHNRSMSKIYSYIGAGLPIVGYELYDTSVVRENGLGILVKSDEDFIKALLELNSNKNKYLEMRSRVLNYRANFEWKVLAQELENFLEELE